MYDVIIVGAGIAGLNAARLLNNNNRKICILEKTNRIGGMIHSKFINITKKNCCKRAIRKRGKMVILGELNSKKTNEGINEDI